MNRPEDGHTATVDAARAFEHQHADDDAAYDAELERDEQLVEARQTREQIVPRWHR